MYCICCNKNNVFPIPSSQKSKVSEEDMLWKSENCSTPDIMDWIWTMLGCLPVLLIQIIK
jgi:hypothetical protein